MNREPDHLEAIQLASTRRRVTRYVEVEGKIVRVVYSLVQSNNDRELMAAHKRLARFKGERCEKPTRLKIHGGE